MFIWFPNIIEQNGSKCKTRTLSDDEYVLALNKKLEEEEELRKLQEEEESMGLLEPLAKILIVWNAIVWAGKFLGWNLEAFPFAIIINIVGIYFHFQMLTNLASIADKRESERGKSIRILRTVETLMNTVLTIMLYLHISEGWMIAVAIVGLIGVIWICSVLFGLARELENEVMV